MARTRILLHLTRTIRSVTRVLRGLLSWFFGAVDAVEMLDAELMLAGA